jgi:hypothetical protein
LTTRSPERDRNTLLKVAEPKPNPLALIDG